MPGYHGNMQADRLSTLGGLGYNRRNSIFVLGVILAAKPGTRLMSHN